METLVMTQPVIWPMSAVKSGNKISHHPAKGRQDQIPRACYRHQSDGRHGRLGGCPVTQITDIHRFSKPAAFGKLFRRRAVTYPAAVQATSCRPSSTCFAKQFDPRLRIAGELTDIESQIGSSRRQAAKPKSHFDQDLFRGIEQTTRSNSGE